MVDSNSYINRYTKRQSIILLHNKMTLCQIRLDGRLSKYQTLFHISYVLVFLFVGFFWGGAVAKEN